MTDDGLTATLKSIKEDTEEGEKISIGDMVKALNSRGYGALLIGPALITVLPTGAIPGVPAITSILIALVSVQILAGKKEPWIPNKLKNFSFSRKKFINGLERVKPYTKKIDNFFYPRLEFLVSHKIQPVIALVCLMLSACILTMGWVPFLAMIPASAILFMGLGLSARDGLLVIISLLFTIGSFITMGFIIF
jgi:hypothetical protein